MWIPRITNLSLALVLTSAPFFAACGPQSGAGQMPPATCVLADHASWVDKVGTCAVSSLPSRTSQVACHEALDSCVYEEALIREYYLCQAALPICRLGLQRQWQAEAALCEGIVKDLSAPCREAFSTALSSPQIAF